MTSLAITFVILSVIFHAILLLYVQLRRSHIVSSWVLLSITILLSALSTASLLIVNYVENGEWLRSVGTTLALAALIIMYGALVIRDTGIRLFRGWLIIGMLWLVGLIALMSAPSPQDTLITLRTPETTLDFVTLGGFGVAAILLFLVSFYGFYVAKLPEMANRALFWVLNTVALLVGIAFTLSGSDSLWMIGTVALAISMLGAVYGQVSYRIFDIRREFASALRDLLVLLFTAAFIFVAIIIAQGIQTGLTLENITIFMAIAALIALLYLPLRAIVGRILGSIFNSSIISTPEATRDYSQQIANAFELDSLVEASTQTLNRVMKVQRSAIILVNDRGAADNVVEFHVTTPPTSLAEIKNTRRMFSKSSAVFNKLGMKKEPISQFDLEFGRDFRAISETERQFFRELGMSAYAPIIAENKLIGILACGTKKNDAPFYPRDLELLSTLANLTGAGLRNARLVSNLRNLNNEMGSLNHGLEQAKEQIEHLDSVKTDFVTIASHELRTPLAQIRGYTDILDALNEDDSLDKGQTASLVSNLRKAAERMEELVTAMLDVSVIDVNAMDLHLAQTAVESAMRMAIEPLTDAVRQRKITLSARGLKGLPPIQADMQRLVQAFRNVLVNAIKFTPDGGRIEITGGLEPAKSKKDVDHIVIRISDTGVGINEENLQLIFQKFFRAYDPVLHSTGTYKFMGAGPGLGLTIAKGVIDGHGGKVWAESNGYNPETFPGTTITISLPVTPPADARRVQPFQDTAELPMIAKSNI